MYKSDDPSREYREMVKMYATLPQSGAESERKKDRKRSAAQTFSGKILMEQTSSIKEMIARTTSHSLLDYGCGKSGAHEEKDLKLSDGATAVSLKDYWQLDEIRPTTPWL